MKKRRSTRPRRDQKGPTGSSGFSGDPVTKWLTDPERPDSKMRLLEPFSFRDPRGRVWGVPSQAVVNGASIPRALWTLVGAPYTGNYRRASIVHDIACEETGGDYARRLAADKMFYHACLSGGCSLRESILLYIGVRIGAIAGEIGPWRVAVLSEVQGPRLARTASEERLEQDFRIIAEAVLLQGEVDDIDLLDMRLQLAIEAVASSSTIVRDATVQVPISEPESREEATKWRALAPICADSLQFWDKFLSLRSGSVADGPRLTEAQLDRFARIIRAVSWVESRHGTGTGGSAAKDPMQCGNPADAWWKELNGAPGTGSRLVGGAGSGNYYASDLPAAAELAPGFPAGAAMSLLANPCHGHQDPKFASSTSFVWGVVYLIHRCNTSPNVSNGRTFACGDLGRLRLIGGAVNYNGGGVSDYESRIEAALRLIGDLK